MIVLLNKPYGVLCQFTDPQGRPTLADYVPVKDVYPAGRLDTDSEGLVVLTDEGRVQHTLADRTARQPKTYWVQVEREPDPARLAELAKGVRLRDGLTRPAKVRRMDAPDLWPRDPPIRVRLSVPTAWIEVTITEGRNRQVRRMTAAVGHATLRLVRVAVGPWTLGDLQPGEWKEAPRQP